MTSNSENRKMEAVSNYWNRDKREIEWGEAALDLLASVTDSTKNRMPGFTADSVYFDVLYLDHSWGDQNVQYVWIPALHRKLEENELDLYSVLSKSRLERESIFIILTKEVTSLLDDANDCRENGYYALLATENDIDAIADTSWSVEELLTYKISRIIIQEANDQDAVFGMESYFKTTSPLEPGSQNINSYKFRNQLHELDSRSHPRELIKHPLHDDIYDKLTSTSGSDLFIHGPSSSGKTSIVLNIGYSLMTSDDFDGGIWYIDIGKIDDDEFTKLSTEFILSQKYNESVIIADDLQANPKITEQLLSFIQFLRRGSGKDSVDLIGVTWPSYWEELQREVLTSDYNEFQVEAGQMKKAIISREADEVPKEYIRESRQIAEDDLFILEKLLRWLSDTPSKPDVNEIGIEFAETIWEQELNVIDSVSEGTIESTILITSCLGRYEISVTPEFIKRNTAASQEDLIYLSDEKILRKKGSQMTLGHRSYCQLIFQYLDSRKNAFLRLKEHGLETPNDIVLDYISSLTPSEIWPILKSLQTHAGFQSDNGLTEHGDTVINTWQTIDYLSEKVIIQQNNDPTWNQTPSSAQFAIQALSAIGRSDAARGSLNFLRSAYQVGISKDHFNVDIDRFATTKDFTQIKERMLEEDQDGSPCCESASELDKELFHANWARGVILCAEAHFGELSESQLSNLAKCVENHATEESYYYPERVPWCTARVLIGLALCGRTIENSDTVKNIAERLLDHPSYSEGKWESGTGTWNTWIEATALSVIGLVMVGVDKDNEKIQDAIQALYDSRDEWVKEDKLLDGVVALQAYSLATRDFQSVVDEVEALSNRAKDSAFWINATAEADEIFDQSCLVTQASAGLLTTMLEFLQHDLARLLDHFDLNGNNHRYDSIDCFVSYAWASEDQKAWVHKFAEDLEGFGLNVEIDESDTDLSDDIPQFMEQAVMNCDCAIVVCTPDYATKAEDRSGGVGYEFKMIASRIMNESEEFVCIPVHLEGDRDEAIPAPLKSLNSVDFRDDGTYDEKLLQLAKTIKGKMST